MNSQASKTGPKLSVVINTKNAAETLKATLESVSFANEVIVVDMDSQDKTVSIAKAHHATVFDHPDVGYVEPARNFAIHHATGDWILIVDADEVVPSTLAQVIQQLIGAIPRSRLTTQIPDAECYYLPRRNLIFNHWVHTGWWPDYVLRLFKAGHVEWSDEIHSIPMTSGRVAELPAQPELAIEHHNYQSVEQYLDRLNRYTTIEAQNHPQSQAPTPPELLQVFHDEFLRRFFADEGILDGAHGAALSLLQPMYQLVVKLKQWQANEFSVSTQEPEGSARESLNTIKIWQRQLKYWTADWHVRHSTGLQNWWWRIRRKLTI